MNRKMIRCVLLGAAALLAAACITKGDFKNDFDSHLLIRFEPDYEYEWSAYLETFFDDVKDTVAFSPSRFGPICHYSTRQEADKKFQGGFALAIGRDADASADRAPSRFAVFDADGGNRKSRAYVVYHDTTAALMPKHSIGIVIATEQSTCVPEYIYVHNVQAAVQAAVHGVGLADGPFLAGDYLTLTVTGSLKDKVTSTKEIKLIDGLSYLKEWTKVELDSLGEIDAMDLHITSSRSDFPLYCCLDDMGYHYHEIYQ